MQNQDDDSIVISRNITEHWLWQDAERLKWWLDLLLLARGKDEKTLVGNKLIDLKRGQFLASLRFLQDRWAKRNKKGKIISTPRKERIISFLNTLEHENLVLRQKRDHQNTVVTICNYDKYKLTATTSATTTATTSATTSATTPKDTEKKKICTKTAKTTTLLTKARNIFENRFNELYGDSYYWQAKDTLAMKRLLKKISFSRTNRPSPLPVDDDSLCAALRAFLLAINKNWITDNFSVTKIDTYYNEIISEIKNQKHEYSRNHNSLQERAARATAYADIIRQIADEDEP